jgi:hypothetical protein
VTLPGFMAQLLGSGGMLFNIGHRMARVELGFNVSGMHAILNI